MAGVRALVQHSTDAPEHHLCCRWSRSTPWRRASEGAPTSACGAAGCSIRPNWSTPMAHMCRRGSTISMSSRMTPEARPARTIPTSHAGMSPGPQEKFPSRDFVYKVYPWGPKTAHGGSEPRGGRPFCESLDLMWQPKLVRTATHFLFLNVMFAMSTGSDVGLQQVFVEVPDLSDRSCACSKCGRLLDIRSHNRKILSVGGSVKAEWDLGVEL